MASIKIPAKPAGRLAEAITRLKREIALNREFVDDAEAAFLSIVWTWLRIDKVGRAFFASHGVTDTQFNTLMILRDYRDRPLRQSELAALLVVNRASLGASVDRMERIGWVARKADPTDRRAWFVHLTAKGIAKLKEVRAPYYRLLAAAFDGIPPATLASLLQFNDEFRARLSALGEQAAAAKRAGRTLAP